MNACFNKNEEFNSNRRIIEAYFGEAVNTVSAGQRLLDTVLSMLAALLRVLTGATACRIAKVSGVALSLVGLIGVIGAMERGTIGLGLGLLIGAVLITVEYFCLRPHRA